MNRELRANLILFGVITLAIVIGGIIVNWYVERQALKAQLAAANGGDKTSVMMNEGGAEGTIRSLKAI